METLHERFTDLAEDAPGSPAPPDLWVEGRRRARVRTLGTVLVAAATVVALSTVGGFAAHRSSEPGPTDATSNARPALPSRVYDPSRWLSGTDGTAPGQLSMVIPAHRGQWIGYKWGLVGVSATTGAYHFLDLPDYVSEGPLSPDGRHLAYWFGSGSREHEVVHGLGIYDTVTGRVVRWQPPPGSTLNLNGLVWNSDDVLMFRAHGAVKAYLWRLGQGAPHAISTKVGPQVGVAGSAALYAAGAHHFFYLDPAHHLRRVDVRVDYPRRKYSSDMAVSPTGHRIAMEWATLRHSVLYVGAVDPTGARAPVRAVPAPDLRWPTILGWVDDQHLMVVNQVTPDDFDGEGTAGARYELARVDVRTGAVEHVADMGSIDGLSVDIASGLLAVPTRDFPAPPHPLNPRVEAGLLVGLVLVGGVALVWWRRRVRP